MSIVSNCLCYTYRFPLVLAMLPSHPYILPCLLHCLVGANPGTIPYRLFSLISINSEYSYSNTILLLTELRMQNSCDTECIIEWVFTQNIVAFRVSTINFSVGSV